MAKRIEAVVSGAVQGVGYRFFCAREATALDLVGLARNRPDGSVFVVAEGEEPALRAFAETLWRGPRAARVEEVRVAWVPVAGGFSGFIAE